MGSKSHTGCEVDRASCQLPVSVVRRQRKRAVVSISPVDELPAILRSSHFPPCVAISFKYGAEAFALLGIAFGLIKWLGRNLKSLVSDSKLEEARMEAIASSTPGVAADVLVRQGIVSADDLAKMTPREREFVVAAAGRRIDPPSGRGRTRQATPRSSDVVTAATSARSTPASPRLHLITPSRPALGISVHCPGCGIAVDREALQRFGATTCPRCKRPMSAHIQRGRLTVIVEETPEEAEHRKRMEGG